MYIVTAVSTLLLAVQPSRSFTLSSYPPGQHGHQLRGVPVRVFSSALDGFSNAEYLDLEVFPHKPLGCTAEESLTESAHVFVSKVVDGGNAEKSGVRIGDVIVGVSGLFGEVEDVSGVGIDRV